MGDISAAEDSAATPRLLVVSGLNDLKEKVARLVLLVIEFFQRAPSLRYERVLVLVRMYK